MKKKPAIILALAGIALLLAARYLWLPGNTPKGQEALSLLSNQNMSEFEKAFDADVDVPRLVLLLSPT